MVSNATNFIDTLLNIAIPLGAIMFFGFACFKAFGPQIRKFGEWLKEIFSGERRTERVNVQEASIVYGS